MSIKVTGKLLYSLTFVKKCKEYNFQRVFKFPRPIYVSEFEILGQIVWDHQIKLHNLTANREFSNCTYKFATAYDDYGKKRDKAFEKSKRDKAFEKSFDLNRIFCATIFGPLYCGGIGGYAYGQTRIIEHRHKLAIKSMIEDFNSKNKKKPREIFVRLAAKYGIKINDAK
jgi:hypothetical protein